MYTCSVPVSKQPTSLLARSRSVSLGARCKARSGPLHIDRQPPVQCRTRLVLDHHHRAGPGPPKTSAGHYDGAELADLTYTAPRVSPYAGRYINPRLSGTMPSRLLPPHTYSYAQYSTVCTCTIYWQPTRNLLVALALSSGLPQAARGTFPTSAIVPSPDNSLPSYAVWSRSS